MNPKDKNFYGGNDKIRQQKIRDFQFAEEELRREAEEHAEAMKEMQRAREKYKNANSPFRKITDSSANSDAILLDPRIIIPQQSKTVNTLEDTEVLSNVAVVIDDDGFVFQRRNGEWFMAGAAFGSTEFSGSFPARILQG